MNVILILCDTLRLDHCGPYNKGKPLNQVISPFQPSWTVETPHIDRIANRGTVFTNAWCGSTPCMPARRDIYTGRYDFLERGWGPLEEDDHDLPRLVSGAPNRSLDVQKKSGDPISYLITDHFHLFEQGSGNYHMGFSGFEFIRGHESDAWKTDDVEFFCPDNKTHKNERHWRNAHFTRHTEDDWFSPRVFKTAAEWIKGNASHDFFLHIDCFDPHEPWDAPESFVKKYDPRGYNVPDWESSPPTDFWKPHMSEDQKNHFQARYAAHVSMVDQALGTLLDELDRQNLWESTLVILTSDHGTFNGDYGRLNKGQTHEHGCISHVPFLVAHPQLAQSEQRDQLVQLVDLFPTVLEALGRPIPDGIHGKSLIPLLKDSHHRNRDFAICGRFGQNLTVTNGSWILHQQAVPENQPLYWYGYCLAKFIPYKLGPYIDGRRKVDDCSLSQGETWLSNLEEDPAELVNLVNFYPDKLSSMQKAIVQTLHYLQAPPEQIKRLGLDMLLEGIDVSSDRQA